MRAQGRSTAHHQNSPERLNIDEGPLADILEEVSPVFGLRSRQPFHRPNPRCYYLAHSLGRAGVKGGHKVRFLDQQPTVRTQGTDHSRKSVSPCRKPVKYPARMNQVELALR